MSIFRKNVPDGFASPTQLPRSEADASQWQGTNRQWWEAHPMRYDWGGRIEHALEVGIGSGSHAQLLASHARSFTGIDLIDSAVQTTTRRMQLFGLPAAIVKMDAERMAFHGGTFVFTCSWGVIHHPANTRRILEQMHRVLGPGGSAMVMIYYRTWWSYYVGAGLCEGILRGDLWRTRSLHRTM